MHIMYLLKRSAGLFYFENGRHSHSNGKSSSSDGHAIKLGLILCKI
jgi:hypothetical protein